MDANLQDTLDWMKRTNKSYIKIDMNTVVDLANQAGSHWFRPSAMRGFGTRLPQLAILTVTGFIYFVSSDKTPAGRKYAIHLVNPETMNIALLMGYIDSRERAWRLLYREIKESVNNE